MFIHWKLRRNHGLDRVRKHYEHEPEGVTKKNENECNILWDIAIQCDFLVDGQKPGIVQVYTREGEGAIMDIAILGEAHVDVKEQ